MTAAKTVPPEPYSHQFLDELALAYYCAIAAKVEQSPALIDVARDNIRRWLARDIYDEGERRSLLEWEPFLREDRLPELIAMMTDPGEEGIRRRQSAPFAGVLSQTERKAIKERLKKVWANEALASA